MVNILNDELITSLGLSLDLEKISDDLCNGCNNKFCIDFDLFPAFCLQECNVKQNEPATVDAIVLNFSENHIIFVEFKDLRINVSEPEKWLTKEKLQQIYLKFHESFHMLSTYLEKKSLSTYDDFYKSKKSIIVVYDTDNNVKRKFHRHFKGKLNRFRYLVENELVIDCQNFFNFIQRNNLC